MKFFNFLIVCVFFLTGCTYQGGIEGAVTQKFTWFSYVNGDDIRNACPTLKGPRYRLVYNAIYQEHRRMYDVFSDSRRLDVVVRGEASLNNVTLNDLLATYRGKTESYVLSKEDLTTLGVAIKSSVAAQPVLTNMFLPSDSFFWTVVGCEDGEIFFRAFKWPDKGWENLNFVKVLAALDESSIDFVEPRDLNVSERYHLNEVYEKFSMQVGKNGLVGFE